MNRTRYPTRARALRLAPLVLLPLLVSCSRPADSADVSAETPVRPSAPDAATAGSTAGRAPQERASGFSITGDTFLAIQVADDSAAAAWWADLFDLEEVNHLAADDGRYSIRLLAGAGLTVELIRLRGARPAGDGPVLGLFKTGFWVDDLDAAHGWLVGQGVDADEATFVDEALGARSFVFRDPGGNRLQVFQRCHSDCE